MRSLIGHAACRFKWLSDARVGYAHCSQCKKFSNKTFKNGLLKFSDEVSEALHSRKPVVALESTIITHGMPYPHNISTALDVEQIIRTHGATPATVAIFKGTIHVGLTQEHWDILAGEALQAVKTSRRDLPVVVAKKLNGGTTVSGTMMVAHEAGIPIFVTGGIGGVHWGAQTTMDISADLTELGRTPVTVVSAGVKSILDIGRTLEYLETQGVSVMSYGSSRQFPSFFTADSGFQAPYNVENPAQAAQVIDANMSLGLDSGLLIGVPIPTEYAGLGQLIEDAVQQAIREAQQNSVSGKDVTPYILQRVLELTGGKSLEANIALVQNNAKVGSQIAVELAKLQKLPPGGTRLQAPSISSSRKPSISSCEGLKDKDDKGKVVVVGGVNVDFSATITADEIQPNGQTYIGRIRQSLGGVGRNIADCLSRLGSPPLFLSAVGCDTHADTFFHQCQHMDLSGVKQCSESTTATYCPILQGHGNLLYGVGDFAIHRRIDPAYVSQFEEDLATAALVCMDGNIPAGTMKYISDTCHHHQVSVWFEPADIHHIEKLFQTEAWQRLTYVSPNLNELRVLHAHLHHTGKGNILPPDSGTVGSEDEVIEESLSLASSLLPYIPNIVVTLGRHGVLLLRKQDAKTLSGRDTVESGAVDVVHYPVLPGVDQDGIISVSGAGDCLAAGIIHGLVGDQDSDHCIGVGLRAAQLSLLSYMAVPNTINADVLSPIDPLLTEWAPRVLQL